MQGKELSWLQRIKFAKDIAAGMVRCGLHFNPYFTLRLCSYSYRIVLVPARNAYWMGFLFTYKNGDFGGISVTEQCCDARISEAESHISYR